MEEEWKDIENFEGQYQVSNYGKVKSFYGKGRILKLSKGTGGYLLVSLSKNNIRKTHWVHQIVAITFWGNHKDIKEINHKDGIKTNNNINNLEWVTSSQNMIHAYKIGLYDEAIKKIRERFTGQIPWNKGMKMSKETKQKISDSKKGKYSGEKNPFYGKKHTIEVCEKLRNSHIGKKLPENQKRKISESLLHFHQNKREKVQQLFNNIER